MRPGREGCAKLDTGSHVVNNYYGIAQMSKNAWKNPDDLIHYAFIMGKITIPVVLFMSFYMKQYIARNREVQVGGQRVMRIWNTSKSDMKLAAMKAGYIIIEFVILDNCPAFLRPLAYIMTIDIVYRMFNNGRPLPYVIDTYNFLNRAVIAGSNFIEKTPRIARNFRRIVVNRGPVVARAAGRYALRGGQAVVQGAKTAVQRFQGAPTAVKAFAYFMVTAQVYDLLMYIVSQVFGGW